MKGYHFIIETVLFAFTFILGISIGITREDGIIFMMMWWAAFGALQVLHSLALGLRYWKDEHVRKSIIRYWCGGAINFLIIGVEATFVTYRSEPIFKSLDNIYLLTWIIFPVILALYLWYITWRFRQKEKPAEDI
jgi:hypothetical protein